MTDEGIEAPSPTDRPGGRKGTPSVVGPGEVWGYRTDGQHDPAGVPPVEPPPTAWAFPPARFADENEIVGVGADLEPGTLLAGYRSGLFPMPVGGGQVAWFSPDPRGVLVPGELKVSRSMRRSRRRFELTVDRAFDAVVGHCADPNRPHGWIDDSIRSAYGELHRLGWAHSIECWSQGRLVGGLYGVAVGGLFAGESMFHLETDASKVALMGLVERLGGRSDVLIDVQWNTAHLASLGVVDLERGVYLQQLAALVSAPQVLRGP